MNFKKDKYNDSGNRNDIIDDIKENIINIGVSIPLLEKLVSDRSSK